MNCKFILIIFLLLLTALPNPAMGEQADRNTGPQQLVHQANELYQARQYAEAEELYRSALSGGLQNASIHYNLGNCAFKQGKLGQAIAAYLRARRLAPRDPDIQWNLNYVRSFQLDQEWSSAQKSFTGELFASLRDSFTLGEYLLMSLVLLWAFCLLVAGRLWKPEMGLFRTGSWVLLVMYLFIACLTFANYLEINRPTAIIASPLADVMSGPDTGTTLFTLHEGTQVYPRQYHGDWVQVRLANGLSGWMEKARLEYL